MFGAEKDAFHVDAKDLIPLFFCDLMGRLVHPSDTGIVHKHVKPTQASVYFRKHGFHLVLIGNVQVPKVSLTATAVNLLDKLLPVHLRNVCHNRHGPFFRQQETTGSANSLSAPRDNGHFVFHSVHNAHPITCTQCAIAVVPAFVGPLGFIFVSILAVLTGRCVIPQPNHFQVHHGAYAFAVQGFPWWQRLCVIPTVVVRWNNIPRGHSGCWSWQKTSSKILVSVSQSSRFL